MFFTGLIFSFWILRLAAPVWPPPLQPRLPLGVTGVNTLVLLASSVVMVAAGRALNAGDRGLAVRRLATAAGLGGLFLLVQGYQGARGRLFGVPQLALRGPHLQLGISRPAHHAVRDRGRPGRRARLLLPPPSRGSCAVEPSPRGDDMTPAAASVHSAVEPAETPLTPESWGKLGMWIFLAGDAGGFGVLLASYGGLRAASLRWPIPFHFLGIHPPAFMTFLLICSSVTMVKALEWLGKGDRIRCRWFLFFTALGGAIFVSLQAYEWSKLIREGLHINGNPWGASLFGTSFFIVTGFHGLHVTGGVIYLLSIIRYVTNRLGPAASYNAVEITGLYWHFVDLVWIMVFTFMYLL